MESDSYPGMMGFMPFYLPVAHFMAPPYGPSPPDHPASVSEGNPERCTGASQRDTFPERLWGAATRSADLRKWTDVVSL